MREIRFWMDPDSSSLGSKCECGEVSPLGIITVDRSPTVATNIMDDTENIPKPIILGQIEDTFAMIKPITATSHAEEILSVIAGKESYIL
jgi:hypothetical protein